MGTRAIRAVLVDDEPLAREILRVRLDREPDFDVVGEAADGEEAVAVIRRLEPDLVFLDIRMPGLDGFQVIEALGMDPPPPVVFVTAFDDFAVRAFEVPAVDYLLKPFDQRRLDRTLARVREEIAGEASMNGSPSAGDPTPDPPAPPAPGSSGSDPAGDRLRRLVARSRGGYRLVPVEDVDWIESSGNYVRVHARQNAFMIRSTMGQMEARLDPGRFVRIHRRRIVNVDRIVEIVPEAYGDFEVVLENGRRLRMSRSYRPNLLP